jgi:hypothetical protein
MDWKEIIALAVGALLVYAWYTEKRRREAVELEKLISERIAELKDIDAKLAKNKVDYDKALADLDLAPVPADMLDHVGQPFPPPRLASQRPEVSPVPDVRSGRLIDPATGRVVDPSGSGEAAGFNGA